MSEKKQTLARPQFHFTPPIGWMNDPNGLIYHNGEYHLFYQHYPDDIIWGPMHWGHAVSSDLVNWEHLPIALYPGDDGYIFSGSAVIDKANTAGFGKNAMVAVYTLHIELEDGAIQNQGIAYSTDDGRTWTKYAGNPVIEMPEFDGHNDFRDPKVWWYGTPEDGHWVMILVAKDEAWLYTSPDLKHWEEASQFGKGYGCQSGVWECPDLFEMPLEGTNETRWVMLISVQDGHPAGANGVQYFVGDFDGKTFIPHDSPERIRWLDYGPDFYAAVTYNDVPENKRILIGWMNNWPYARVVPATTWRGTLSVPRELTLVTSLDGNDVEIRQAPVSTLAEIWRKEVKLGTERIDDKEVRMFRDLWDDRYQLEVEFFTNNHTADQFGMRVRVGYAEETVIHYAVAEQKLTINRSKSGEIPSDTGFERPFSVDLPLRDKLLKLTLVVDTQSLEVFADDGRVVLSQLIFPSEESQGVVVFSEGGEAILRQLIHKSTQIK